MTCGLIMTKLKNMQKIVLLPTSIRQRWRGVPDKDDAFPDDPDEDTDTDGDGIGDNSDIIASVNNDVIWISSGILG